MRALCTRRTLHGLQNPLLQYPCDRKGLRKNWMPLCISLCVGVRPRSQ